MTDAPDSRAQPTPEPVRQHAPLPWSYRPWDFDDWGFVRADDGSLAAVARGYDHNTYDDHRIAGTDPYGPNALLIVEAVNSHASLKARIEELEGRLRMILAKTEGERHTVNEQNVFKYWDLLNLMMIEIRDIARNALPQSRDVARTEWEPGYWVGTGRAGNGGDI